MLNGILTKPGTSQIDLKPAKVSRNNLKPAETIKRNAK